MKPYFLCMESGGTKTLTCGIDLDGNIIYEYHNGVGSPAVDYDLALKNIHEGIENVYNTLKNDYELVFIELGISGLGRVDDVDSLKNNIHNKYHVEVDIVTDAEMSLHSILKNQIDYGILVVSGTRNATCAINNNNFMIVGGGGQLLDEEGSGYSLIHKSVLEIKRKYEHGIPYDVYDLEVLSWTKCKDFPSLKTFFYAHTKSEMASFVYNVMNILKFGDEESQLYKIAKNNVQKQGFYLATQVTTITNTLKIPNGAILGLVGGFWRNNPILLESFENHLKHNNKHYEIVNVDSNAVMGCYYLAIRNWRKIC